MGPRPHRGLTRLGARRVVSAALRSARFSVPFFANQLEWQGGDRWHLVFPYAQSDCRVASANCKCSHAQWSLLRPHVVIGDGRSDFCMSTRADYVIAKGALTEYCRARGQEHASFADFNDVTGRLSTWFTARQRRRRGAPNLHPTTENGGAQASDPQGHVCASRVSCEGGRSSGGSCWRRWPRAHSQAKP